MAYRAEVGFSGRIARAGLTIIFVAFVIYYVLPRKQSFTVFASTEYLVVRTVNESSPDWELPDASICLRTNEGSRASSIDVADCDNSLYEQHRLADITLRWSEGYTLTFQGRDPSFLLLLVGKEETAKPVIIDGYRMRDGQADYDSPAELQVTGGSILRIPWDGPERPLIPMRGRISIGHLPDGRHEMLLREARYEIRQTLGITRRPSLVAQGDFYPGDRIGFARQSGPFWDRGATAPAGNAEDDIVATLFVTNLSRLSPAFDMVATSPSQYSALRLTRIGSAPTIIPVSWTQRIAADTIPVALATLFGLLATAIALSNTYFATPPSSNGNARGKADPDGS
ncbi:hypothetical protein ABMC89_14360 [Sulfitobacter sp. HNIBRBA3233]|uniref:hypothetical protein n=1 Tax=Sulfitobacter marinivivus TaxID=3158558 RepID=UPI0032DE3776